MMQGVIISMRIENEIRFNGPISGTINRKSGELKISKLNEPIEKDPPNNQSYPERSVLYKLRKTQSN